MIVSFLLTEFWVACRWICRSVMVSVARMLGFWVLVRAYAFYELI